MQRPTLWREMDISAGKALSPVEVAHLLSEYKRRPRGLPRKCRDLELNRNIEREGEGGDPALHLFIPSSLAK